MNPAILAVFLIGLGGFLSLLFNFRARMATWLGLGSCLSGCVLALSWGLFWLFRASSEDYTLFLSSLFLLPISLVGAFAAIHALGYLSGQEGVGRHGLFWFFYNLTLASMLAVTQSNGPIAFLLAWESMCLFSFALVAFDHQNKENIRSAWIYFIACHVGGALLILMFVFRNNGVVAVPTAFLLCGLLGFGLKAGFPMLHIWLPEAYPAAPPAAAALLSGGMVNLGFYGILRWLPLPGMVSPGQLGMILLIAGVAGALLGIAFALPQKNLKRLLAYSSVENMGIVNIGMGLGFLGLAWQRNDIALLGFCGAFLHLLNHSALKGGLFLAAGNVLKGTGLPNMDQLGGLQKRLPKTGTCFTLSAVAISGLPPGNAFFGEILLYVAASKGIASDSGVMLSCSLAAMLALAMSGGLAATVFAKAISAVFQGEPRSDAAKLAAPLPNCMTVPLFLFLAISLFLALGAPFLARKITLVLSGQADLLWPQSMASEPVYAAQIFHLLLIVLCSCLLFALVLLVLYGIRKFSLPRSTCQTRQGTWDCGFARPDSRMQYTGTAFVQPLADLFAGVLRPARRLLKPQGLFPKEGEIEIACKDGGEQFFWKPLVDWTVRAAIFAHRLQSGHLHLYILVMVVTLLVMLLWAFAG